MCWGQTSTLAEQKLQQVSPMRVWERETMQHSAQHAVTYFWHTVKSSFCCCTIPSFMLKHLPMQLSIFWANHYCRGAALSKPAGFSLHTEAVLKKCEHSHFICVGSHPRTGQSNLLLPVKQKCSKWETVIFDWHVFLMRLLNALCMDCKTTPTKMEH